MSHTTVPLTTQLLQHLDTALGFLVILCVLAVGQIVRECGRWGRGS